MPGHKREYDGQFAQIEVGFILNDPRCTSMTSPEFRYYIFVWCLAVKERMEVLPIWWDATSLQRHCSLDTRTARKCRSNLLQKCILEETPDGRLIVCGVKRKHPNLKWKENSLVEPKGPLKTPQTEDRNRNRNRNKKQKGNAEQAPPVERFNKWVPENTAILIEIAQAAKDPDYDGTFDERDPTDRWLRFHIKKMRIWLLGNPKKGNKKDWKRFVTGWLNRSLDEKPDSDFNPYEGYMTAAQEKDYFAKKKRSGPNSDFTSVGETLT